MLNFPKHKFTFSNDFSLEVDRSPYWNGDYLVIETTDTAWFSGNDAKIIERYYDDRFSCTYLRDTYKPVIVYSDRVEIPIRREEN